jgi:hypothetical protein
MANNLCVGGRDWADAAGGGLYNAATSRIYRTSLLTNVVIGGRAGRADPSLTKAGHGWGGGVFNGGDIHIVASTLAGNRAEGGAGIDGCLGCSPWPLKTYLDGGDGEGGAIFNSGTLYSTNSTLAANQVVPGPAYVASPTVRGLPGDGAGSALLQQTVGASRLAFVTIARNVGPGGSVRARGTVELRNSILADGFLSGLVSGIITDGGHNLSSDDSAQYTHPTSRESIDPHLKPLASYGGFTLTMMPDASSPAIDSADPVHPPSTDQRGVVRPQGGSPDIGAVEATFLTIERLLDKNVRLRYSGIPGVNYTLEGTSSLGTSWTSIITQTAATSGALDIPDQPAAGSHQIFRIRTP